jgi:hypothetical protein
MALVTLTVVPNGLEAEELSGLLRVNGIECSSRRTGMAMGMSAGTGMGGPTEILVDESDLERARELLEADAEPAADDGDA